MIPSKPFQKAKELPPGPQDTSRSSSQSSHRKFYHFCNGGSASSPSQSYFDNPTIPLNLSNISWLILPAHSLSPLAFSLSGRWWIVLSLLGIYWRSSQNVNLENTCSVGKSWEEVPMQDYLTPPWLFHLRLVRVDNGLSLGYSTFLLPCILLDFMFPIPEWANCSKPKN